MRLTGISLLTGIVFFASSAVLKAQENILDLYYSGNYTQVIEQCSSSISSGDTTFNTHYLKALSEIQLGLTREAIATLENTRLLYPENISIRRMLPGQYEAAGDYVKAWDLYQDLVESDSSDVASWLKLADIASFRQHYPGAIKALEQVLLIDSLNLSSLMMMGEILNRHNNSGAVIYYERAYRLYPDNQKAAYALGNMYIQSKKAWEAVPVCKHILEIDSTNIKFRKLLGYAYYKMGKPYYALPQYSYATQLGDSTAFTFKYKGICHYLSMDFASAIESLQQAALKDSTDAEVFFFLGASMATTTAKKEAMVHLDKSLELMQPDPIVASRIYSEQGNIKRLESSYEEAYSLYNKAWETDSTNLMALYYMASILDNSMHRSEEALVDYQRYIEQLDRLQETSEKNQQSISIRTIVEDRIIALKEELFFLDRQ
ncbi:MAG: tetratricopeptide repeat protein [Bacteroidota bacterium]